MAGWVVGCLCPVCRGAEPGLPTEARFGFTVQGLVDSRETLTPAQVIGTGFNENGHLRGSTREAI